MPSLASTGRAAPTIDKVSGSGSILQLQDAEDADQDSHYRQDGDVGGEAPLRVRGAGNSGRVHIWRNAQGYLRILEGESRVLLGRWIRGG